MKALCSVCDAAATGPDLCDRCAGLLRWFRGYVAHVPGLPAAITAETRFLEDLRVASLDWMSWPLEAEEKLGVVFPDSQLEQIRTVGQFLRALRNAGALWPDGSDVKLRTRRRCLSRYQWQVVEAPMAKESAPNPPNEPGTPVELH